MARQESRTRPSFASRAAPDVLSGVPGLLPAMAFEDPASLPKALSHALRQLASTVGSVEVCEALVARLPHAPPHLARALVDVGAAADRSGIANAYHNPLHSRDVGVVFINLSRLQSMMTPDALLADPLDLLTGCCAAFGHDIGHDGQDFGSAAEPFRLERIAADRVGAIMDHHTVEPHLIDRVYCAIMATEVHSGYRALDEAGRGALSKDIPGCLHGLSRRKDRETACLLRDADVMQSAGLTPEDHDRQTARLEAERGMPVHAMGVRGADFFLKDVIKGRFLSEAGRMFQPQLDRLLRLNARRAQQGAGEDGLAAFDGTDPET